MNHRYHTIQGWSHHLEPLYDYLIPQLPPEANIVEVGSWRGRSITYLQVELINRGKSATITAVDHWLGSDEEFYRNPEIEPLLGARIYEEFLRNIQGLNIQHIRQPSLIASESFPDSTLDLVILDDAHDHESVVQGIRAWYPCLRPGSIIAGDDCDEHYPGVRSAVTQEFGNQWQFLESSTHQLHTPESSKNLAGSWIYQKPR